MGLSLNLRKSVEERYWLSRVEPMSVRAVMKRVVEDVAIMDEQVGEHHLRYVAKTRILNKITLQNAITVLTEDLAGVIENVWSVWIPASRCKLTVCHSPTVPFEVCGVRGLGLHLLDKVLGSGLHRSLEQPPQLMEPNVVEVKIIKKLSTK